MSSEPRTRLAVLGSPIAHSKSPAIQRAAYAELGLGWRYDAVEVTAQSLGDFVRSRDSSWRGLSLTMPLKRDILPLLDSRDALVDVVGGANTVLFTDDGLRGYNTDVMGVVQSFADVGVDSLETVQILGAGATAASVIVAVAQLGGKRAVIFARTPEKAANLAPLGRSLGVEIEVRGWGVIDSSLIAPDAIISTLPGGANDMQFAESIRQQAVLFDVAYDPWPSALASSWADVSGTVISGLDLLINQAVGQIRVFVGGDVSQPLQHEAAVIAAMRGAV